MFLSTEPSVWRNPKSERNRIRNFFPIPNFFDTESDTFFDTKFFPIPIPILFSIPEFFETESDTFFDTKIFRNRYRYFFYTTKFLKPIPILFYNNFFWNWYRYHQRNMKKLNKSETFLDNIFLLDIVIVIMPRLIAFQPCSTFWVQNR